MTTCKILIYINCSILCVCKGQYKKGFLGKGDIEAIAATASLQEILYCIVI